ncbi:MAG: DegT/DnrJ/EryC1/StrS family aminotransferase, partial [Planctomycetales bacterium]|nr:DegT/DnrJ/EryC1/StrS family aminotransferase [Planctomycetales bacterium]
CVASIGTNGKMSEVSAAIGLTSLEHADRIIEINAENQGQYQTECESIPGVTIRQFNAGQRCNFQYVIAEVDETQAGLSRDELMNVLRAENVLARRYFYPGCHRLTPYEARGVESLPWTDAIVQRVLVLPTGIAVDQEDIRAIAQIMRLATTHAADLRRRTTIRQELPLPLVSTQSYPVSADVH